MARIKEHPVTQILNLIEALSEDEKRIIFDHVRPAPKPRSKPKPERKPSQKRKAQTVSVASETVVGISDDARCGKSDCARFFDDNIHRKKLAEGYHEFVEPASEAKGASTA